MGKFYLENKHKWFKHQGERGHKTIMEQGGSLAVANELVSEIRFFYNDEGKPPAHLRISDHNQPQLAVIAANGYVGVLDDESSVLVRNWLKENPEMGTFVPAVLVREEECSGAYIIRLGCR